MVNTKSKSKKGIKKLVAVIVLAIVGYAGWYMVSPLFFDKEVQEAIPAEFLISENTAVNQTDSGVTPKPEQGEVKNENQPDAKKQTNPTKTVALEKTDSPGPQIIHTNNFEKVDYEVTGSYQIIENNGKLLLRIEGLDITNGPDLHFVLSNTNQPWGNRDFVKIAKLPGNKGSYNVPIPDGIKPADYQYLLIHCVIFSHTFASGKL